MRLDTPAPAQLTLPNARTHAFDVRRSVLFNEHGLLADEAIMQLGGWPAVGAFGSSAWAGRWYPAQVMIASGTEWLVQTGCNGDGIRDVILDAIEKRFGGKFGQRAELPLISGVQAPTALGRAV